MKQTILPVLLGLALLGSCKKGEEEEGAALQTWTEIDTRYSVTRTALKVDVDTAHIAHATDSAVYYVFSTDTGNTANYILLQFTHMPVSDGSYKVVHSPKTAGEVSISTGNFVTASGSKDQDRYVTVTRNGAELQFKSRDVTLTYPGIITGSYDVSCTFWLRYP